MLDPTSWQRKALDRGKATACLSYDQILKSIAVNARWMPRKVDWQQSFLYFDGIDDPFRSMDFYVDGRLMRATTASVLRIDEGEYRSAVATGRALIARLKAENLLVDRLDDNTSLRPWESYRQKYVVNAGTGSGDTAWQRDPMLTSTDVRVNDPSRFLTEYPIQGDIWSGRAGQSLVNLPIPRRGNGEVFIGPAFWNNVASREDCYPVSRMCDDMTEALAVIVRLHRAANTHPGMSPALFFGMRSPDWSTFLQQPITTDVGTNGTLASQCIGRPTANGTLTGEGFFRGVQWVERSIGYFPSRFALPGDYSSEPGAWDFNINGPANALWRRSAASRQRKYWMDGSAEVTTADAVVDYAQIMNLLAYFVNLPPHVTLHSAMYFHNFLFRTSYQQVEAPYGTSFAQYRQRLNAEYAATSQATAIEKAASGFDMAGTPVSLEGQTVKSLVVAIGAIALGAPLAVVGAGALALGLMAVGAMIEEINRAPYRYNPDPGKSVLRDQWRGGLGTNFWRYYTPDTVTRSRPCIVYE